MRRRSWMLCALLASVLLSGTIGRGDFDTGVPPYRVGDSRYEAQAKLAFVCDPAIEQAVRLQLATAMTEPLNGDADVIESQLRLLTLAANYQIDEAGPPLVRLYRQSGTRQLDSIAEIAACYRTDAAEPFQRTLLAEKRFISKRARDRLLVALAERGDDAAAEALAQRIAALDSPTVRPGDVSDVFDLVSTTRSRALRDRVAALPPATMAPTTLPTWRPTTSPTMRPRVALATRPTRTLNPPRSSSSNDDSNTRESLDGQRYYGLARRSLVASLDQALLEPAALMDRIAAAHGWQEADVQMALIVLGKCGNADDAERLAALRLGVDNVYAGYDYMTRLKTRTVQLLRHRPAVSPPAAEPTTRGTD